MMGDKLSLCDNIAMVTGDLNQYPQEKNVKNELCPGGSRKKSVGQDGGAAAATRYKAGAF